MGKRLDAAAWTQVRNVWEYDVDQPSYLEAGRRASAKFGFACPSKSTIQDRADREKWERKAAGLAGVNAAAQRKADGISGHPDAQPDGKPDASGAKKGDAKPDAALQQSAREEAEDLRAKVLARHRKEWEQVVALRQEAIRKRPHKSPDTGLLVQGSVGDAFEAMKLAKITAEATHIQQAGERKAWGLDIVVDPDQLQNLSDEDLALIAAGKAPRGTR